MAMSTFNLAVIMALFIIVVSGIYHLQKKISRWLRQKQRKNDTRQQSKISYTRAFFMEQRQHNQEAPSPQLKEIVKQILSQKDGDDDQSQDADKNVQQRTQRISSYNFQQKSQPSSLLPKNRKKTSSIDQGQGQSFRDNNSNGINHQFQVKPTKTTSIPLSQIIQNIEQQNQLNQVHQEGLQITRENISLSSDQVVEISNCLKTLIANLRTSKAAKKVEKDQQSSVSTTTNEDQQKLSEYLSIQKPSGNEVVQTLIQFSHFKQSGNPQILSSEDYKQLTLICIQEWADFLLQDMQTNSIQPDRFLLDEYMRIVANFP